MIEHKIFRDFDINLLSCHVQLNLVWNKYVILELIYLGLNLML